MEEKKEMIAEVDLMENAVYRVKDGVLEKLHTPPTGFGEHVVIWQNNKPEVWRLMYTNK